MLTIEIWKRIGCLFFLFSVICFADPVFSQDMQNAGGYDGLLIAPTRIVFGPRDRVAEVVLANRSTETRTYRLSMVNKMMTEHGALQEISAAEASGFSADRLLIYAPRQIVLGPDETQKVRLMVRRPEGLDDGEFRSHLVIKPEINSEPISKLVDSNSPLEADVMIGVKTTPALSIPLIVRHGQTEVAVNISDITFVSPLTDTDPLKVRCRLTREGNQGEYGDVIVTCTSVADGLEKTLGVTKGIAIYTPNLSRYVSVPIAMPEDQSLSGTWRVFYRTPDYTGGDLLAEGELTIP